ncbi:hypothetical protein GDO86_017702 [Hymenochirus boettgeri]|uniref:Ig-like domain-containing protein n=1 Tax=Hymenochirus boettgeri TaxID=247094 RepID=A0A8T2ING3_9PIPI|nr:hypothetical protein GDO86_017702 [Hymenochirus boettgeri]
MVTRGCPVTFLLFLITTNVLCQFVEQNSETVTGVLHQQVSLDCSFQMPKDTEFTDMQVIWFKNFTDKLIDCKGEAKTPVCQYIWSSSKVHISPGAFNGDATITISDLQESDSGQYQCWVIFPPFYYKKYMALHVPGEEKEVEKMEGPPGMRYEYSYYSKWDVILIGGWFISVLLTGFILIQKLFIKEKRFR